MKKIEVVFDQSQLTLDKGAQAVKDAVTAIRNALRAGTASTKSKGEVAGSNKKPWKQKGTGNARAGFRQSPVWRGGAVAFGPTPRSYEKSVNKKVEKLALKRAFTDRLDEGVVIAVDDLKFDTPKTKEMNAVLKALDAGNDALVLVDEYTENVDLAARNLPNVLVLKATSVNPYLLLLFKKIIITTAGLKDLGVRLA